MFFAMMWLLLLLLLLVAMHLFLHGGPVVLLVRSAVVIQLHIRIGV